MARPKTNNLKWQIVITPELAGKVEQMSKQTGIGKSALIALALAEMFAKDKWQLVNKPADN